jgi:hypothetical protein
MKKIIIFLISVIILGCDKDEELTAINGNGTGGVSCILNGTILNPSGGGIGGNRTCRIDYFPDKQVYFFVIGFTSNQFGFSSVSAVAYDIDLQNFEGQTFDLIGVENSQESYGSVTKGEFDVQGNSYSTNSIRTGTLKILHYDYAKSTVSGTFEFTAENNLGEIVTITEGRFDSKLGY